MLRLKNITAHLLKQEDPTPPTPTPPTPPVEDVPIPAGGGLWDQITGALKSAMMDMVNGTTELIPKLIVGIIIFIIGYVISRLVRRLVTVGGDKIGLNTLADSAGITKALKTAGIRHNFTTTVGTIVFVVLIFYFLKHGAQHTNLAFLRDPLQSIIDFLPRVIEAIIVAMVGYAFADLVKNVVTKSTDRLGLDYGAALANLIFGFILILVLTLAVTALGVDTGLINRTVEITLAALGLAIAIALGLGLNPLARSVVSGVYAREMIKPGNEITLDGVTAKVDGVGPVMTRLSKADGSFVLIPNKQLVENVVQGTR